MAPVIRIILKWLLLLFAVMVIGGALIYSLRGTLIAPFLATWIEQQIEAETGLTVSVDRVGGTWFEQLIIENLVTREATPGNPLRRLDLKRFEATYSLFTLLKGKAAFIESMGVDLKQAAVTIDWRVAANASPSAASEQMTLPVGLPAPDGLPRIHLENSALNLRAQGVDTQLVDLDVDLVRNRRGEMHLALTAASLRWDLFDVSRGEAPVRFDLYYSDDSITISPFTVGEAALTASARINLTELPDALPFNLKLTTTGAPAEISGRLAKDFLETRFNAEQLDLDALSSGALSEAHKANGRLSLSGDLRFPLKRLDLSDPRNRIDVRELLLPFEWVVGAQDRRLLQGVSGSFQLDLQDVPVLLRMVSVAHRQIPSDPPAHRLRIEGALERGAVIRAEGDLSSSGNTLRMEPSRLEIPIPGRGPEQSGLAVHLRPDFMELGSVSRLFPIPALGGRLKGDVSIEGTIGRPRGRIDLYGQQLVVDGIPVGSLTALVAGDGRRITAESVRISNGTDAVDLRGSYDVQQRIVENVRLALKVAEIRPYLAAWTRLPDPIQGDLQGEITANGPITSPAGELSASSRRLQIGNTALADIRLKATGRNGELRIESAEVTVFETLMQFTGSLRTDERFEKFDAGLNTLSLRRRGLVLQMPQPAQLRLSPDGDLRIANFVLEGTTGEIRLEGKWSPKGASDVRLRLSRLSGKGWFSDLVGRQIDFDGMDAEAHLQGTVSAPRIELVGMMGSLQNPYVPIPLKGRFNLVYEENRLIFQEFDWIGEGGYRIRANGSATMPCSGRPSPSAGQLSLTSSLQLPEAAALNVLVEGQPIEAGSLAADLKMEGSWREPVIELQINARGMEIKPGFGAFPPGPLEFQGRIQYREGSVFVDTLDIQSPSIAISANGVWSEGYTAEIFCSPPAGELPGKISIDGTMRVSDIAWLSSRLPEIRRIEGSLDADFNLRGPVRRPAATANVSLKNGVLRPQMNMPPLTEIQLQASVTPSIIEIRRFEGLLGGAAFRLDGTISEPMADNPVADLRLRGDNLLFYRDKGFRLRADTDLALRGPLKQLILSGELAVTDGLLDRYIDWLKPLQGSRAPEGAGAVQLFSIRQAPLRDMRFDVRIGAKAPFRIRSNIIRGMLRPDLRLTGTGEAPLLLGKVYVDSARLRLPSGTITMENGLVQFLERDPDRPVLELGGSTRMLGYDITMLVDGYYDNPVVTLTSSPPLSNEDLLLLVLTGTPPPREGQAIDTEKRNLNVAVYIGRDLIARWFDSGEESSTEAILERFETEVGRDVTQKGSETLQAQFRLSRGIFQDNDTLYITGEKDVFDYYNAGLRIVFRFQ